MRADGRERTDEPLVLAADRARLHPMSGGGQRTSPRSIEPSPTPATISPTDLTEVAISIPGGSRKRVQQPGRGLVAGTGAVRDHHRARALPCRRFRRSATARRRRSAAPVRARAGIRPLRSTRTRAWCGAATRRPSSCSSNLTWRLSAGWATCNRSAARVKLRSRATATKYCNRRRSVTGRMLAARWRGGRAVMPGCTEESAKRSFTSWARRPSVRATPSFLIGALK